jgi:hypothetical protein
MPSRPSFPKIFAATASGKLPMLAAFRQFWLRVFAHLGLGE